MIRVTQRCLLYDAIFLKGITKWVSVNENQRLRFLYDLVKNLDLETIFKHNPKLILGSVLEKDIECLKIVTQLYKGALLKIIDSEESQAEADFKHKNAQSGILQSRFNT